MKGAGRYAIGDGLGFKLEAAGIRLELALIELEKLHLHEEIIPELLEDLAKTVKKDDMAKHPVIADKETLVVLDGMHRVAAFEKLGCEYMPTCLVDYKSPKISLGCWYRTVHGGASVEEILDLLESLNLKTSEASMAEARGALDSRIAVAAIFSKHWCHLLKDAAGGIREAYVWIGRIEKALADRGLKIGYETERDAERKVRAGEADAVLMTPKVRKEDVLEVALSGNVFVHKTTRHVVPARPMGIDVPLEWLMGKRSRGEVDRMFVEHLSKRKLRRLSKGKLFEGRRYEEELLVFE